MVEEVLTPWAGWGQELRRVREFAGHTQGQLSGPASMSRQSVSKYEMATRKPNLDIVHRLDRVSSTGGLLHQMWKDIDGTGHVPPEWVDFLALKQQAIDIREYQAILIPGLLQSAKYMRWIFRRGREGEGTWDRAVSARLARLDKLKPGTTFRAVVDEPVLRRIPGSVDIMREQYDHILHLAESGRVILMITPEYAPWRPIAKGAFRIMTLEGGRQIVHLTHIFGHVVKEKPSEVVELVGLFGDFQAESLSPTDSIALLRKMRDEL
ncbi:helix-turn-helix transcriptional regulator [Streptomonospora halophila]|uniref:Helix-turn-helix transcriptional regulator n=1 Tax=Streptomonospora halophila TaxID=427369 RepID=A0ABP9GUH5_9ACTN